MVNEMTTSQKAAALHLYQQQIASTETEVRIVFFSSNSFPETIAQGGDEAFVIDESGPGDLEDESELDPSKYMENMSGEMEDDEEMEEVIMEDEEEEIEEVEDSIEMSGLPEISDVVSMAE